MTCATNSSIANAWGDPGPLLGIRYDFIDACVISNGYHSLYTAVLIVWIVLLIRVMSGAASQYFSPTLEIIRGSLNVAGDFVGVTLLALGNSAPDFFTLVASAWNRNSILIGISAMLGAGLFVCTVAVGSIAICSSGWILRAKLLRDTSFQLLATCCAGAAALVNVPHVWLACVFLSLYSVYIILVLRLDHTHNAVLTSSSQCDSQRITGSEYSPFVSSNCPQRPSYHSINTSIELANVSDGIRCNNTQLSNTNTFPRHQPCRLYCSAAYLWSLCCSVLHCVDYAVLVVLDLTIPSLSDDKWDSPLKYLLNILQPAASIMFLAFVARITSIEWKVFAAVCAIGCSTALYLHTCNAPNKPPSHPIVRTLLLAVSFIVCAVWMYLLANELLACLEAVGMILNIPKPFLGLTVLAWGNSMGDFWTNTAVAKHNLEMSLAGCYAAPVFNILVGFSVALMCKFARSYGTELGFDWTCYTSLVFLLVALSATIAIVLVSKPLTRHNQEGCAVDLYFELRREHGLFLLSVYVLYMTAQVCQLYISVSTGET